MAESTAAPAAATADATGKKMSSKVKIAAIVGAIVLLQCVLAFMYLPSGNAAKDEAKKAIAPPAGPAIEKETLAGEAKPETREVDLGKFSLTAFDPNSNTTLLIDFHLCGVVPVDHDAKDNKAKGEHEEGHGGKGKGGEGAEDDNSNFGRLFKQNKNRFRDQVIVIIRNAQMADLTDASLGLIKRQILTKTNSLLGEPLLKEVLFSDFAVVQQ